MSVWTDHKSWKTEWELVGKIGSGGQGSVSKVRRKNSEEIACLKILNKPKDMERRARFSREATAYDTCLHPLTPRLLQSNAHEHKNPEYTLYIVTEFIPGPTMTDWIESTGPKTLEESTKILSSLIDTTEHFHMQGWVHRDIKPDNIILRNSNISEPFILDFGLAYKDEVLQNFETEHGQELGNRFLRLPELSVGSPTKQDTRTDLAFLGGIFFYLLTTHHPATLLNTDFQMPHQRPGLAELLKESAGNAAMRLLTFFDHTFAQMISGRFASAGDMRDSLDRLMEKRTDFNTPDDDWEAIEEILGRQANKDKLRNKTLYDQAINQIRSVHTKLLEKLSPHYKHWHTGHVNFEHGMRLQLGFSDITTQEKRFAPEFLVKVVGEELVIYANNEALYRTSITSPHYSEEFLDRIRYLFIRGVRSLAEGTALPGVAQELFKHQPHSALSSAISAAQIAKKLILIVIYDDKNLTLSNLDYALGAYLRLEETKDLISEHFISALLPISQSDAKSLIDENNRLEDAWLQIISPSGAILANEKVYPNANEGLKQIKNIVINHKATHIT